MTINKPVKENLLVDRARSRIQKEEVPELLLINNGKSLELQEDLTMKKLDKDIISGRRSFHLNSTSSYPTITEAKNHSTGSEKKNIVYTNSVVALITDTIDPNWQETIRNETADSNERPAHVEKVVDSDSGRSKSHDSDIITTSKSLTTVAAVEESYVNATASKKDDLYKISDEHHKDEQHVSDTWDHYSDKSDNSYNRDDTSGKIAGFTPGEGDELLPDIVALPTVLTNDSSLRWSDMEEIGAYHPAASLIFYPVVLQESWTLHANTPAFPPVHGQSYYTSSWQDQRVLLDQQSDGDQGFLTTAGAESLELLLNHGDVDTIVDNHDSQGSTSSRCDESSSGGSSFDQHDDESVCIKTPVSLTTSTTTGGTNTNPAYSIVSPKSFNSVVHQASAAVVSRHENKQNKDWMAPPKKTKKHHTAQKTLYFRNIPVDWGKQYFKKQVTRQLRLYDDSPHIMSLRYPSVSRYKWHGRSCQGAHLEFSSPELACRALEELNRKGVWGCNNDGDDINVVWADQDNSMSGRHNYRSTRAGRWW